MDIRIIVIIQTFELNHLILKCSLRITGLDPAFPGFYPGRSHLRRTDARMVDVIHTDAWLYGAPFATGTVDFWPNRGRSLQPGCPKRDYKRMSDNGESVFSFATLLFVL